MSSNFFPLSLNNISIINNNREDIFSPLNETKNFWCHICKKKFMKEQGGNEDIKCPVCGQTFCELIENDDTSNESHPIHFEPFTVNDNNETNLINNRTNSSFSRRNIIEINNIGAIRTQRIFDFVSNYFIIQQYNNNFDLLIQHLMRNDPNKYGNPPASKNSVEKLTKYKIDDKKIKEFGVENSCGVCKDEFNIGEECLSMPCNHYFHENCLIPWLKQRNSCPICRYELPTDDPDFEEMKKIRNNNGNNRVDSQ